jgi:hypothetical protein
MPFPGRNALWPTLGATLIIAAGRGAWVNRVLLSNKVMVGIGLISYPLYLWHWPLLSLARIVEQETPSREIRLAAVALSFVLAALTYYVLEKPLRRISAKGTMAAVLCVLLALTAYLGWNVYKRDGYGFRDEAKMTYTSKDPGTDRALFFKEMPIPEGIKTMLTPALMTDRQNAKNRIMLLGDSHAYHLGNAFASKLSDDIILLVEGDHIPLLTTSVLSDSNARLSHQKYRFSAEALKDRSIVVLSAYWVSYGQTGSPLLIPTRNRPNPMVYHGKHYEAGDFSWFEPALRETLTHLTSMGKTVILTHDVPELPFQSKECMDNRPLRLTNKHAKDCTQTKEAAMARQHVARTIFPKVLADFPQVKLFDPIDTFCPTDRCIWADKAKKISYYIDGHHLSQEGGEFYAKAFKAAFPELFAE